MPRRTISSENPVSRGTWSTRVSATKVPRPGIRSRRPSATRASSAWRTVIRATPKSWTSSRSEGAGVPGSASATNDRTYSRTCTCLCTTAPRGRVVMTASPPIGPHFPSPRRSIPSVTIAARGPEGHGRKGPPHGGPSVGGDGPEHVEAGSTSGGEHRCEHPDQGRHQHEQHQRDPRDLHRGQPVVLEGAHHGEAESRSHEKPENGPEDGHGE